MGLVSLRSLTSLLRQTRLVRQSLSRMRIPNSLKTLLVHSTRSSWSSTVKTDSRNKVVSTSTRSNHSTTTLVPQCQVSTRTLLPSSQKSTNQRVLNFSRIDNAQVAIKTKASSEKNTLHMFAVNYNVLRIQFGMGGLAFSN